MNAVLHFPLAAKIVNSGAAVEGLTHAAMTGRVPASGCRGRQSNVPREPWRADLGALARLSDLFRAS